MRIGIPFDNDDQLLAICHYLSAHNSSLYRTPIYVRDGVDGKHKRLQRGTGLYGFEIKQRKDDNPYANPKKFPVLKYILICSTDQGGVDTQEHLDWKFSWDRNLGTVYRGGERAIRTFPYTHTGTADHFLACAKKLPVQVSMHNDDYLAERERMVTRSSEKRRVEAAGGQSSRKAPALGSPSAVQGGRTALTQRLRTVGSPSAALAGCMGGMAMSPTAKAAEEDYVLEGVGTSEGAGAMPYAPDDEMVEAAADLADGHDGDGA